LNATTMMATTEELSADEIALYDRQLRLWGIEAQNRMRKAKVLLITIKALGNEVAKNLVLAGIGSLTVVDDAVLTASDVESQFLVTKENVGQNVNPA
jgi:ubiquitin-like 1-activating enzyme E1 A